VKNLGLLRRNLAAEGIKVSVNDIIIKCVGNALQRVPKVNCVWDGEKVISMRWYSSMGGRSMHGLTKCCMKS
jgi:pyruvate/2-oxoglutarate dehydrogenase complex dihydrolipoamide acyltransferase (E2) component